MNRNPQILSHSLWAIFFAMIIFTLFWVPDVSGQSMLEPPLAPERHTLLDGIIIALVNILLAFGSYFIGRYFEKIIAHEDGRFPRVTDIKEDPSLKTIIKEHKIMASLLVIIAAFLVGYFFLWVTGTQPYEVQHIGWGGFSLVLITLVPTAWALARIIRM